MDSWGRAGCGRPEQAKDPPIGVGAPGGSKAVSATVAIVWPCPLSVEEYQAAGRGVRVPRADCPECDRPMVVWSGYQRYLRDGCGRIWRVWVVRARCRWCRGTHALLPSFALLGRVLVAGLCALLVEFGGLVDGLPGVAERAALAALGALAARVRRRLGGAAPAVWPLAGIVSGGGWLGATTSPPWAGRGRTGWLAPVPRPPPA